MTVPYGMMDGMCRSVADGGRRCSRVGCRSADEVADRRAKAAARQRRYMSKKRSEVEPENPFTNFTTETITLTAEERDAEKARLADFFARKRRDPNAQWDAGAAPVVDADENPFAGWVSGQPIPER